MWQGSKSYRLLSWKPQKMCSRMGNQGRERGDSEFLLLACHASVPSPYPGNRARNQLPLRYFPVSVISSFFFLQDRVTPPPQQKKPGGPGAVLCQSSHFPTVQHRRNYQGQTPTGIALGIIETHKPHHQHKLTSPG